MAEKRNDYRPCSDRDIRAAALRATHEIMAEMDNRGEPTVGKFGDVLRGEKAKFRAFGEHMAEKDPRVVMTWDELKTAAHAFTENQKK